MDPDRLLRTKSAISPIIATLILILIAISAGVVVYAYVAGFLGNTTSNTQSAQNTISIQYLLLASARTSVPVIVFVTNLGPGIEYFDTGFYAASSSTNVALSVGMSVTETGAGAVRVNEVVLKEVSGQPTEIQAVLSFVASCPNTVTITVAVFGATTTGTCTGTASLTTAAASTNGITLSSSPQFAADTGLMSTGFLPGSTASIVGAPVASGSYLSIGVNGVGQLTLAPAAGLSIPASNPFTSGFTYTIQIVGKDDATSSKTSVSS